MSQCNYQKVCLLLNCLQTKPQVKSMKFIFYELYYTVNKKTDEKKLVIDEYEIIESDYVNFDDFITPIH